MMAVAAASPLGCLSRYDDDDGAFKRAEGEFKTAE